MKSTVENQRSPGVVEECIRCANEMLARGRVQFLDVAAVCGFSANPMTLLFNAM